MGGDPEGLEAVTALQALAARVHDGAALSDADLRLLVTGHDLIGIGMLADEVRRTLHGTTATYARVFEMHVESVPDALPPGTAAGEVRIIGRPASLDSASAAVAKARQLAGDTALTGFSMPDLVALGSEHGDVFARLKQMGLDAIADVPVDRVQPAEVQAARAAGLLVLRLTATAAPADPVALLARAHELASAAAGFRAFAPLPRAVAVASPTTGYDDMRLVAAARIHLRDIPSIQVDWPLYGPKLAQVALTFGADDVDGVAAVEPGTLGARRSALEEIRRNIRAAGFDPVERDGRFTVRAAAAVATAGPQQ